jgi:hypothetical protein
LRREKPSPFKGESRIKVLPRKEKAMEKKSPRPGYREVFCAYVIRKGKIIYPKKAKVFHFFIKVK